MKKIVLFTLPLIVIVSLIIGGIYINNEQKKEHYLKIQKKRIDLFFEENLVKYKKTTITSTGKSPMGYNLIRGYINNDKQLKFEVSAGSDTNYQFDYTLNYPKETADLIKPHRTKLKFPSEIIKEKHLKKEDYEADPPPFF